MPAALLGILLCSCATKDSLRPANIMMNKDAGRGSWLVVMVRLEDGEKLPFILDTGSPFTLFDKSLAPKLGKSLGVLGAWNFDTINNLNGYAVPRLYLGNTLLITDTDYVLTGDTHAYASVEDSPTMGIIGMDILRHYCIQLDFKQGVIRFLDDETADKSDWGKAFSLAEISDGRFILNDNLAGIKGASSLIDTGANTDGWLLSNIFQQWTNRATQTASSQAHAPDGRLAGEIYQNLDFFQQTNSDHVANLNGIGLGFLAKHLVTFDFPQKTMYLKRTGDLTVYNSDALINPVFQLFKTMLTHGRLPGFLKDEHGTANGRIHFTAYPNFDSVTVEARKKNDPTLFSYLFAHASEDDSWKLKKAWQSDQNGRLIEEYNCP